jgi:hypothetical protein
MATKKLFWADNATAKIMNALNFLTELDSLVRKSENLRRVFRKEIKKKNCDRNKIDMYFVNQKSNIEEMEKALRKFNTKRKKNMKIYIIVEVETDTIPELKNKKFEEIKNDILDKNKYNAKFKLVKVTRKQRIMKKISP